MVKFNIIPEIDQLVMQAVMRYVWPMFRSRKDALARASYYVTEKHRRRRFWFCEVCGERRLEAADRAVDHIVPRMPPTGYDNLSDWLARTLCEADGLQVICKKCHDKKSAEEAGQRAAERKKRKKKKSNKKGKRGKK
jgi:5-methylcytosine-specific restriction endonuclease McrA